MAKPISVDVIVRKDIDTVWEFWNSPKYIQKWMHASADWECPHAENDVVPGGKFLFRMSAKDKSFSFDFIGTYTDVQSHKSLSYTVADGRNVHVLFEETPEGVRITETFDPENVNPEDVQRAGWQAILNNFRIYAQAE